MADKIIVNFANIGGNIHLKRKHLNGYFPVNYIL